MSEGDGQGRVVVITGASRGIGAGLVDAYRAKGWSVVANARTIEPGVDGEVLTVQGDVADPETADRIVGEALGRFGRIDSLVNNAGIYLSRPFTSTTDEEYRSVVEVNLTGFFMMTRRALAEMVRQGTGPVVSISTTLVENANAWIPSALAALTKGGIVAATRSLAIEYAAHGIRVNAVSLGVIQTAIPPVDPGGQSAGLHPLGRMGTVGDVADAILFLETATFVTGEILHVDGGQSAGH